MAFHGEELRRLDLNYSGTMGLVVAFWVLRVSLCVYDLSVPGRYISWPNLWLFLYDFVVHGPIVGITTLMHYNLRSDLVHGLFLAFTLLPLVSGTYIFIQTQKVTVGRVMMSKIFASQCLEADAHEENVGLDPDYAEFTSARLGEAMYKKKYVEVIARAKETIGGSLSLLDLEKHHRRAARVLALAPVGILRNRKAKKALYARDAPVNYDAEEFALLTPENDASSGVYEEPRTIELPHVKTTNMKLRRRITRWTEILCVCRWLRPILVVPYEYAKEIQADRLCQHLNLTFLIVAWNGWLGMFMQAVRRPEWYITDDSIAYTTAKLVMVSVYVVVNLVYQKKDYATFHLQKNFYFPSLYVLLQQWSMLNEIDTKGNLSEHVFAVVGTLLISAMLGGLIFYGALFVTDRGVLKIRNDTLGRAIKKTKKFERRMKAQERGEEEEEEEEYYDEIDEFEEFTASRRSK